MTRPTSLALSLAILFLRAIPCLSDHTLEVVERGKKATALVEVTTARGGATGSGFCIDRSGLFITNAHVVRGGTSVRLIIEIGQKSQRRLRARVLRADDAQDLALLQVDGDAGLTPLELGRDDTLHETDPIVTFGFPFGPRLKVGNEVYPDITVLRSRITALRRDKGRLEGIQFDNQLNPGNSGGPVVDEAGRVVGVAVATVPGAAINLAIPVGRLSEFLASPGLVFDPPPLAYKDRSRPVTWSIKVQPPTPLARLPERLSVTVTIANGVGAPRSFTAQAIGDGLFRVKVTPVPHDPDLKVHLDVRFPDGRAVEVEAKDRTVSVGGVRYLLSDLQTLFGGSVPRAFPRRGPAAVGPITGLGRTKILVGKKSVTVDLDEASQILVRPLDAPPTIRTIEALVEAKQGTKVLATVLKKADFAGTPAPDPVAVRVRRGGVIVPGNPSLPMIAAPQGPSDDGLVTMGGTLDVDGVPRGAGGSIRPPEIAMGEAKLGDATPAPSRSEPRRPDARPEDEPLVRRVDGPIDDVAVGGGGRYLILTLKEAHKLAVFDLNAANVIKTIPLPSSNALVAAGSRQVFIAFPDQNFIERLDLEALDQPSRNFRSPIRGRLKGLAMGHDSEGPLLAVWLPNSGNNFGERSRFSFLDTATLMVLKVGLLTNGGFQGIGNVSPSGGSLLLHPFLTERVHVRASSGGELFGIWQTQGSPSGFQTLAVRGRNLQGIYNHESLNHLAPGPDGETIYTGRGGVLNAQGKPVRGTESRPPSTPVMTIPTPDPAYYLEISGLVDNGPRPASTRSVTAVIHSTDDGARLLTINGLDEMNGEPPNEAVITHDFTVEKRIHLIPAARLLITIPFSNDRLVLRRLDLRKALERQGRDYLIITSQSRLHSRAGEPLSHQIEAFSKAGGIHYALTQGPDGLTVTPEGKLNWLPPKGRADGEDVTAIITVSDSSGQQRFNTVKISIN